MGNKNGGESTPADLQKSQEIDRMILGDKSARRGKTTILLIGNSSNGKNQFLKELRNQISPSSSFSSPSIINDNVEDDGEINSETNDTTKVTDFEFTFENNPYRVIDPGALFENQKNLSRPFFQDVTSVVFFSSLSDYDQQKEGEEGEEKNLLRLNINKFEQFINLKWFETANFILLFTKKNLLEEKLKLTPLSICFDDYTSPSSSRSEVESFITEKYKSKNKSQRKLHVVSISETQTGSDYLRLLHSATQSLDESPSI